MLDNKNLILGSIAVIAVVIVAIVLFFPKNEMAQTDNKLEDVKVYIHHEKTKETQGYYSECNLSTEDLVKVRNAYNKINKINEESLVTGVSINGDYKVIVNDKFIAFDKKHNNQVYYNDINGIFNYKSDIYDIVIKACEE